MAQEITKKIRETLNELYGDERTLIVLNKRDGVVSVGFGENGDKLGHAIERTNRPIRLTDIFPAKTWLDSSDFRTCLAKGHLEVITVKEAEEIEREIDERAAKLAKYAERNTDFATTIHKATIEVDSVPGSQAMILDEDTAGLVSSASDPKFQKMVDYMENFGDPSEKETAEQLRKIGGESTKKSTKKSAKNAKKSEEKVIPLADGELNPQALLIIEGLRKGTMNIMEAIEKLDDIKGRLTDDDFGFLTANSGKFPGFRDFVNELLAERDQ